MYQQIVVNIQSFYWLLKVGKILRKEMGTDGSFESTVEWVEKEIERG